MSEKPRRLWQIHLSTAVVLMFVAGGLLWLNVMFNTSHSTRMHEIGEPGGPLQETVYTLERGFPLTYYTHSYGAVVFVNNGLRLPSEPVERFFANKLAVNLFACGCFLVTTLCFAESLIRRRERTRIPAQPSDPGSKPCP